jgi:hypothetical protein
MAQLEEEMIRRRGNCLQEGYAQRRRRWFHDKEDHPGGIGINEVMKMTLAHGQLFNDISKLSTDWHVGDVHWVMSHPMGYGLARS